MVNIMFVLIFFGLISCLPSYAESSGYYGLRDDGRPPSVFSLCCCKKLHQDSQQALYKCNYVEAEDCPEETKQYQTTGLDCPSNLMFTKYVKAKAE